MCVCARTHIAAALCLHRSVGADHQQDHHKLGKFKDKLTKARKMRQPGNTLKLGGKEVWVSDKFE